MQVFGHDSVMPPLDESAGAMHNWTAAEPGLAGVSQGNRGAWLDCGAGKWSSAFKLDSSAETAVSFTGAL